MTTTFELATSIDPFQAFGISRVVDPYSVYNSLSRIQPVRAASVSAVSGPPLDSADISGTSSLVAAALSNSELRTERIAALRQSISNGSYRLSSTTVAGSVVNSLLAAR